MASGARRSGPRAAGSAAAAKPDPRGPALSFAADPEARKPEDAVEVARVLGAWGIKGAIKLKAFAADPQALFASKRWYLEAGERQASKPPGAAAVAAVMPRLLKVVQAREQGEFIVATAQDLDDRTAAEALAGARVFVSRASFPTPDDDEFYWVDLIGLDVRNRQGLELGRVSNLLETGPHCVLRVQPPAAGAAEVLIPFVDAYVDRVDREARLIHVDWDAGD